MISEAELLKLLRCPETHQELRLADPSLIAQLNEQIAMSGLKTRNGQPITEKVEGGLIRADGKFLYPIRRNIPIMLTDAAIPIESRKDKAA